MLQSLRNPGFFTPAQIGVLRAIDEHDFSWVIKSAKADLMKHKEPVLLNDKEAELSLKQYYDLIAVADKGTRYAVSSALDPYWHTHVFDTRGYADFCRDQVGGFIHHVPLDADDEVGFADVAGVYLETLDKMQEIYINVSSVAFPKNADKKTVICLMHWGD